MFWSKNDCNRMVMVLIDIVCWLDTASSTSSWGRIESYGWLMRISARKSSSKIWLWVELLPLSLCDYDWRMIVMVLIGLAIVRGRREEEERCGRRRGQTGSVVTVGDDVQPRGHRRTRRRFGWWPLHVLRRYHVQVCCCCFSFSSFASSLRHTTLPPYQML